MNALAIASALHSWRLTLAAPVSQLGGLLPASPLRESNLVAQLIPADVHFASLLLHVLTTATT